MRIHSRVYEDPQILVVSTCNPLNTDCIHLLRDCKMLESLHFLHGFETDIGESLQSYKPSSRSSYKACSSLSTLVHLKGDDELRAADLIELQAPQFGLYFVHLPTCNHNLHKGTTLTATPSTALRRRVFASNTFPWNSS